jgi:hypothetical protein
MAERTLSPLFTWRSVICDSELPASVRHVALVLSLHMSERGDSCFPRIDTLAGESGLTLRTVADNLKRLEKDGYLTREFDRRGKGRGTKVEYRATFPTTRGEITCPQTTRAETTRAPAHDHTLVDDTTTCGETAGQEDVMRASEVVQEHAPQAARPKRGHRIPDDFALTPLRRSKALEARPGLDVEDEFAKFCDFWRSSSGRNATKLDWGMAWMVWVRNSRVRPQPKAGVTRDRLRDLRNRGRRQLADPDVVDVEAQEVR